MATSPPPRPQVGATCFGVGHAMLREKEFDVCILDEAGQITLPASLGEPGRAHSPSIVARPPSRPARLPSGVRAHDAGSLKRTRLGLGCGEVAAGTKEGHQCRSWYSDGSLARPKLFIRRRLVKRVVPDAHLSFAPAGIHTSPALHSSTSGAHRLRPHFHALPSAAPQARC